MVVAGIVVIGLLLLCALQVRHVRRVREDRARLFDDVAGLLDDVRRHHDGLAYPVLTGSRHGRPVRLTPVADALTLRKLPVLWLVVEQRRELDVAAPLDILLRPTGTEFFSPNSEFAGECPRADWLPGEVRIASPRPDEAPPVSMFEPYRGFLSDHRAKELCVTERGVRLVWRIGEGAQAPYRSTRRADFGPVRVLASELETILVTLTGVGDALARHPARSGR